MTENLPNLRDLAVQGHEAESKEKERLLKSAREKKFVTYIEKTILGY